MSTSDALAHLSDIPRDGEGPVFAAPWQAQAFAMAVALNEQGVFTWSEWAEVFSRELAGECDVARYYDHWLAALEKILEQKTVIGRSERISRRDAFDRAARATPHGEPIVLGRELAGGNPR